MKRNIDGVGEVTTPSGAKEKIQNFWYHYKLHTALALLLVVAIVVCSLQLCTRESYDAHVLYAGSRNIGRTAKDGDVAEIVTVISSLKRIADDFDENGDISLDLSSLYYLDGSEAANADAATQALLANDRSTLSSLLEHSEYYLCFISVAVYESYHGVDSAERFIDLTGYRSESSDLKYYSDSAIYLSSTEAYKLPGLSSLPDDTLICIRQPSILGAKSKSHMLHFENAKKMLENILKLDIK